MKSDENFPVASRLIRRDLRPVVIGFYRFARTADNIADAPSLDRREKLARLDAFDRGLADGRDAPPEAAALHALLAARNSLSLLRHGRTLLSAFRQDAGHPAIGTWSDLRDYCDRSANPVGRFLLELHGEGALPVPASDALCTALQILNHLQDLKPDRDRLGRVYLPADWMREAGATAADISAPRLTPALRRAVDRTLDRCDRLLIVAAELPSQVRDARLAGESRAILHLARRLSIRLRRGDPLGARIAPGRFDFLVAGTLGLIEMLRPRMDRFGRRANRA